MIALLASIGSLILAGSAALLFLEPLNRHVPAYLAVTTAQYATLAVLFFRLRNVRDDARPGATAALVLGIAALLRLAAFASAPTLSDDVYRYAWDGRVQAAGVNPWVYAPVDPALERLRDADHARINHPTVRTIYPPLSEWMFRLGHVLSPSPAGQKAVFALWDLAAVGALLCLLAIRRRPLAWAALYAWSPTAVMEFAGSGHNDSLMIFLLLAALSFHALRRDGLSAVAFAAATMAKWIPVIVLPWFLVRRRWGWVAVYASACAVMGAPFLQGLAEKAALHAAGTGAPVMTADWIFNASLYEAVARVVGNPIARKVVVAPFLAWFAFWWAGRRRDLAGYLLGATLALLLAGPVVHPWYLAWVLPHAALLSSVTAFLWSWLATLSYVVQIRYATDGVWHLPFWAPATEYALVYATLGAVALRRLRRPRGAREAPGPMGSTRVSVVIPALNEAEAIGRVIADLPRGAVSEVIVADNGSTDGTVAAAEAAGARVVRESRRGYGAAVKRGIDAVADDAGIVVVLDGDRSDFPEDLGELLDPILRREAHMVIGSRVHAALPGSLMPQQRFGNWLTCVLIRWLYGFRYTDMGPFRAIRRDALREMRMEDPTFGWNVEMQVKALQLGLAVVEVPVRYRPRIGKSKISGTVKGSFNAGVVILWSIYNYAFRRPACQAWVAINR